MRCSAPWHWVISGNTSRIQTRKYKGADSTVLLKAVYDDIISNGYRLGNADITVIAQMPRLSPYIQEMCGRTAEILDCDVSQISVKATTEEKMGFTGEGIGIAAHAVVLLEKIP